LGVNNLAENAMRTVALGRRNWIHVGSQEAGPRVAAIISIVETCRRLGLPLRDYLGSVLPGLADPQKLEDHRDTFLGGAKRAELQSRNGLRSCLRMLRRAFAP
jgi:hypothetical protein